MVCCLNLSQQTLPSTIGSAYTTVLEVCAFEDLVSHDLLLLRSDVFIQFGLAVLNQLVDSCLLLMALYPGGTHSSHGVDLGRV